MTTPTDSELSLEITAIPNAIEETCWVGGDISKFMTTCYCGKYPSKDYPNGACHLHGTCAGGPNCDEGCL